MTLILFIIINLDENLQNWYYSDVTVTVILQKFTIYRNQFYSIEESKIGMILNKYFGEFPAVVLILSLNSYKKIHGNVFEIIKRIAIKVNHYN